MKTYKGIGTRSTPQSQPVMGKQQARNNAGGYVFQVDQWKMLERFLILGSEGGSYYVNQRKLTMENAVNVSKCVADDPIRVVDTIVAISQEGRAPSNDPALFALAMCAGLANDKGRQYALDKLYRVARIGTHLFHFAEYVKQFRGWGRGLRTAIANWYLEKSIDRLAYQVVKYQQRDGWSHRDLLRLSHPKTANEMVNNTFAWITGNEPGKQGLGVLPDLIEGYERAKVAEKPSPELITRYGLTHEMIPTDWKQSPAVWEALLQNMPLNALVRNLAKMTEVGLLTPFSDAMKVVVGKLQNEEHIRKSRLHPVALLKASTTYGSGQGFRGNLTWKPVGRIVDALDDAFYLSFQTIEPSNKNTLIALDVSGSMTFSRIEGLGFTPRVGAACMAMVTARTEPNYDIMAFCDHFVKLNITAKARLEEVVKATSHLPFGGTDCALPMVYASQNNLPIDTFIVYTDNETWAGRRMHPFQALQQYRQKSGRPAKLIVVGMIANDISIADPNDAGMMDVVGFDANAPAVMADFARQ